MPTEMLQHITELHVPTEVHVASVTCGALTCEMIQVTCLRSYVSYETCQ